MKNRQTEEIVQTNISYTYDIMRRNIEELKQNNFIDEILENKTMTYFATELGKNTLKELIELERIEK